MLHDIAKEEASHTPCLIFEYIPNTNVNFSSAFLKFSEDDCKQYMFKLLTALEYAHSNGIMHRDVKPLNIMYD